MGLTDAGKAGVALFVGVVQFAIFEMVAEFVYPGYSVSLNYISDLGPPCAGGTACPSQTSWVIFDVSIALLGLLVLVSAYFLYRYFRWKPLAGLVGVAGIGALGVGIFNETAPYMLHSIFSLITFIGIGLAAVVSYRFQKAPLSYFAVIMGAITLLSLVLYIPGTGTDYGGALGIGAGGLERMIVYPVLLWSIAFGGHLMAMEAPPRQ
jgi:hypothetical membrane protein